MTRLGGPDVLAQPGHQRQVVGEPAHERHRRMGVQVDESRDEHVAGQVPPLARRVVALRLPARRDRDDSAGIDDDHVIGQHDPGGLDRHHPLGGDEAVDRTHHSAARASRRSTAGRTRATDGVAAAITAATGAARAARTQADRHCSHERARYAPGGRCRLPWCASGGSVVPGSARRQEKVRAREQGVRSLHATC